MGQSLLIIEASPSHWNTPHSVELLWTSDQPDRETSTWQHTTFPIDRHWCPGGIRTLYLSNRSDGDPNRRRRGYWFWRCLVIVYGVKSLCCLTPYHGCFLSFHVLSKPPLTVHTTYEKCCLNILNRKQIHEVLCLGCYGHVSRTKTAVLWSVLPPLRRRQQVPPTPL